jgi:prefoldin subunit 5
MSWRLVMSSNDDSLAERVQLSYLQLSAVASDLNTVSDELGKSIAEIDAALKKLNLGVSVWVAIVSGEDEHGGPFYWSEDIGYDKIGGKWGIALRSRSGNYEVDEERVEAWLFNDAPRSLRLSAIERVPDLLQKLSEEAVKTTNKIKSKLAEAQEVATAVKNAAQRPPDATRRVVRRSGEEQTK